jgi:hypothetical protein
MKLRKHLGVGLIAIACLVATSAAAKAKDFRNIVLRSDATVAGAHLASGNYNVQWQTHSPQATVSFMQGSKVVATAEGKVVDHGTKCLSNEVVFDETADGGRVIREIRFKGSSEVIEFNE